MITDIKIKRGRFSEKEEQIIIKSFSLGSEKEQVEYIISKFRKIGIKRKENSIINKINDLRNRKGLSNVHIQKGLKPLVNPKKTKEIFSITEDRDVNDLLFFTQNMSREEIVRFFFSSLNSANKAELLGKTSSIYTRSRMDEIILNRDDKNPSVVRPNDRNSTVI